MITPYDWRENWKHKLFDGSFFFHRLIARRMKRDVLIVHTQHLGLDSYEPRLAVLELMTREIKNYGVEGATAEVGVYRGKFAMMINHYLPDRKLYLFDTFEGFDERDAEADRAGKFSTATEDFSRTSEELVLSKMEHRENCIIRKGWFPETAEGIDDKFCLVSLDADLYQPILAGLEYFYPRLNHGGVIIVHDFNNKGYTGVRQAVREFSDKNSVGYVCLPDECGTAVIVK